MWTFFYIIMKGRNRASPRVFKLDFKRSGRCIRVLNLEPTNKTCKLDHEKDQTHTYSFLCIGGGI